MTINSSFSVSYTMDIFHDSIFYMFNFLVLKVRQAIKIIIALAPCLISIYTLYWLQYSEIWTSETAHRGKLSVATLVIGMGLSFLTQSYFKKHEQK